MAHGGIKVVNGGLTVASDNFKVSNVGFEVAKDGLKLTRFIDIPPRATNTTLDPSRPPLWHGSVSGHHSY